MCKQTIIIMADGSGSRWDDPTLPKQLLEIDHHILLQRTVTLCQKYQPEGHIVLFIPFEQIEKFPKIHEFWCNAPDERSKPILYGFLRAREVWDTSDYVSVLLGDVIYSHTMIQSILYEHTPPNFTFFGRNQPNAVTGKIGGEIYGAQFHAPAYNRIKEYCQYLVDVPKRYPPNFHALQRVLSGLKSHQSTELNLISIKGDYTDDIDTKEEYGNYFFTLEDCAKKEDKEKRLWIG